MGIQITTPMLKLFETTRVLHVEPTDVCQAACPLCARETDIRFNKNEHNSLSLIDFKSIVPEQVIYRLDKMFLCGNYGDPAANAASKSILAYAREVNSSIVLGMNTNGGLQDKIWWADLANVLYKPQDYAVFSIDGLEDTNHIYRKNVSWDRVMRNAETFIEGGGRAHWDMLVYEHNEHQVDACEKLARDMGFKWFRAKVSRRPSTVEWLKPPKGWANPIVESSEINCYALKDQSVYLDAKGKFYPCCWQGYGDVTLDKFDTLKASWNTDNCDIRCKRTCGSKNNSTSFTNQWQREVQLY